MTEKIDFDDRNSWFEPLRLALQSALPSDLVSRLEKAELEFIEDALDLVFKLADRDEIIDRTLAFVRERIVVGFHGTRITENELSSIQTHGLKPLKANERRARLERALGKHPEWDSLAPRMNEALEKHGKGERAGRREDQVHLTLSRAGLTKGFNHYLAYGAEFDQHVAQYLLGKDGLTCLANDGVASVLRFDVPGEEAIAAVHPHFSVEDVRRMGEVPNLVSELLKAWSFGQAHNDFSPDTLRVDCGLVFKEALPVAWLSGVETIANPLSDD